MCSCAATICPRGGRTRESFASSRPVSGSGSIFSRRGSAWREDPRRCDRLHFVSDRAPSVHRRATSRSCTRAAPISQPCPQTLRAAWPVLVPGMHRLHFDEGRVTLTLVFADVSVGLAATAARRGCVLPRWLRAGAQSGHVVGANVKALARLAKPGATLATWSVARAVRDALVAAGFAVDKRPGLRRQARHAGRSISRRAGRCIADAHFRGRHCRTATGASSSAPASPVPPSRRGLPHAAGTSTSSSARAAPAAAASGLRAGVFQPHVSRDDCLLSRLTRAGFLYAQAQWPATLDPRTAAPWQRCGVLQLADGADNEARVADTAALLAYPRDYAQYVTRDAASALAGRAVAIGRLVVSARGLGTAARDRAASTRRGAGHA